jgi:hypothetical protein
MAGPPRDEYERLLPSLEPVRLPEIEFCTEPEMKCALLISRVKAWFRSGPSLKMGDGRYLHSWKWGRSWNANRSQCSDHALSGGDPTAVQAVMMKSTPLLTAT